jgi:ABC-2 type transport system ATP-binding protein
MLQVNDLVFEYPGFRALDEVSFTVQAGSITALVGPNGAGKTTLMKCVAGLTEPLEGTIFLDGIDVINQPREAHRKLAFLPDSLGLYVDLTCEKSLMYFGMAHGLSNEAASTRAQEVIKLVQLEDKLHSPILTLSRGMKQRLAIAQALIHKPKLLILDEPASGLDPEARFRLAKLFVDLKNQGLTILVSSHILAELDEYATDLLVLEKGKVIQMSSLHINTLDEGVFMILKVENEIAEEQKNYFESLPLVKNFSYPNSSEINFLFQGNLQERRELYAHLISVNFLITDFNEVKTTMQDQYISILNKNK